MAKQKTIKKEISMSGIGLHSGERSSITFKPAEVGSGITFTRTDLPGKPKLKADINNVKSTIRGTSLGEVSTVEHVLSALYALSVTNLMIELDGQEPPALDGSSKQYCDLILRSGVSRQNGDIPVIEIKKPVLICDAGKCIVAMPSDRFKVSFMINYPVGFIGSQFFRADIDEKTYIREIAPARTYGFMEELDALKEQGLALGASAENAVAMDKNGYITKLRFKDELVRHKVLDLIGDISLLGCELKAHIIGVKSGHDLNIKLARKLKEVV